MFFFVSRNATAGDLSRALDGHAVPMELLSAPTQKALEGQEEGIFVFTHTMEATGRVFSACVWKVWRAQLYITLVCGETSAMLRCDVTLDIRNCIDGLPPRATRDGKREWSSGIVGQRSVRNATTSRVRYSVRLPSKAYFIFGSVCFQFV